jgi:hypothetical protein
MVKASYSMSTYIVLQQRMRFCSNFSRTHGRCNRVSTQIEVI